MFDLRDVVQERWTNLLDGHSKDSLSPCVVFIMRVKAYHPIISVTSNYEGSCFTGTE